MIRYIILKKIFLSIILLTAISTLSYAEELKRPTVVNGDMDISTWDFSKDGNVRFAGKWEFYWNKLLTPKDFPQKEEVYFDLPKMWNNAEVEGAKLSHRGYATYRAVITIPKTDYTLCLKIPEVPTAYKVFVNGQQVASAGTVATKEEDSRPQGTYTYHVFKPTSNKLEIVMQTSNYFHRDGGTWNNLVLGKNETIQATRNTELIISSFLVGSLLIMAIYHFLLYGLRRKNPAPLFFGLFCLVVAIRGASSAKGNLMLVLWPDMSYDWWKKFEYFGFYIGQAVIIPFLQLTFKEEISKWATRIFTPLAIVFTGIVMFASPEYYTDIIEYFQIISGVSILYVLVCIIVAVFRKREGALILLLGFIVFATTVFSEIYVALTHQADGVQLAPLGLYVMVFSQSAIIAIRFSKAFTQIELMHVELLEKEKARTLFFHNTSHELRTPLNGIIGFVELLKLGRYGDIADKTLQQIEKIGNLAKTLKNQVNTILILAKSKKGENQLKNTSFRLNDIVTETCILAEGLILKTKGLSFNCITSWDNDSNPEFINDKENLLTIIRNLIGNAFKFKNPQRDNKITIEFVHSESKLSVKISDTGIGIPKDEQQNVFNEFEQVAKEASRSYEGTGLGLSIVKSLVKLMNGEIELVSSEDIGTTVTIHIPAQKEIHSLTFENETDEAIEIAKNSENIHADVPQTFRQTTIEDLMAPEGNDYKILVVDDNLVNLEVITEVLKSHGYPVESASGGEEGLIALKERTPDLLILDLMMPDISGEDVLKVIREEENLQDLPVILLTARASQDDKLIGLSMGADDYLAKPIVNEELLLRVKNTLIRIDLARTTEKLLSTQRLAQLGELMGEVSHEIKNIFSVQMIGESHKKDQMLKLLTSYHKNIDRWSEVVKGLFSELSNIDIINQRSSKHHGSLTSKPVRSLFMIMKKLAIDEPVFEEIWDILRELSEEEIYQLSGILNIFQELICAEKNSTRAYNLMQSILDFSRERTSIEPCAFANIINSSINLMHKKIYITQVKVRTNIEPNKMVRVNPSDFHQIVLNLISNANDALSEVEDYENRKLEITSQEQDDFHVIKFKNNGPQIPSHILDKIFENKFSTKGEKGTGIGLYVCNKLAVKNGGKLKVTSSSKETEFSLWLQRAA